MFSAWPNIVKNSNLNFFPPLSFFDMFLMEIEATCINLFQPSRVNIFWDTSQKVRIFTDFSLIFLGFSTFLLFFCNFYGKKLIPPCSWNFALCFKKKKQAQILPRGEIIPFLHTARKQLFRKFDGFWRAVVSFASAFRFVRAIWLADFWQPLEPIKGTFESGRWFIIL